MDSIVGWGAWIETNFLKITSADARLKYSSLLIEHEFFDFPGLIKSSF
jgi:hypothetical protein